MTRSESIHPTTAQCPESTRSAVDEALDFATARPSLLDMLYRIEQDPAGFSGGHAGKADTETAGNALSDAARADDAADDPDDRAQGKIRILDEDDGTVKLLVSGRVGESLHARVADWLRAAASISVILMPGGRDILGGYPATLVEEADAPD